MTSAGGPDRRPPTLSVVVCAYTDQRWNDLTAALTSVLEQTAPAHDVVLVSDHADALLERARAAFPAVTCVPNDGPKGLSGARNTGVARATGEIVAFLDDDAVAAPDWLARMSAAYADPTVVGVGGDVEPAWRAPRPSWFPEEFLWVVGCSYRGLPTTRADIRNPIGANMSFRRAVIERAGGFDVAIGRLGKDAAGCEETELSIRVHAANPGSRIVLEPSARCTHAVTPDRVTRRYFRQRCRAEGRSKALVSRLAGADAALETERGYVLRTLPRGILRGFRDLLGGDLSGGARALAIVEGAVLTAVSYFRAKTTGPTAP